MSREVASLTSFLKKSKIIKELSTINRKNVNEKNNGMNVNCLVKKSVGLNLIGSTY